MKKIKIVVVQYKIQYLNVAANLAKFNRIIKKHLHLKPDLIIFPEYALSGPLYANYHLAIDKNHHILEQLSLIARKNNVCLIPGSFICQTGTKKYNTTIFINRQGKIIDYYQKQKLWGNEKKFLSPGWQSNVVKTELGKIALQICADLNSPQLSADYKKVKPDIIINLALWSKEDSKANTKIIPENSEYIQTEVLSRARAIENKCYFIFCNHAGKFEIQSKTGRKYPETSIGNSMIINPYGEIINKTHQSTEEILFAELDLAKNHWASY